MLREFKAFVLRGNVLDLAVAFILGAAFGRIVNSFVTDIVMPPIGLVLGRVNFENLFITLTGGGYPSLQAAKAAGAPTINYGVFISTVIDFLVVAFVIFLVLRQMGYFRGAPVTTRECPYCASTIPVKATRCPNCTSALGTTPA